MKNRIFKIILVALLTIIVVVSAILIGLKIYLSPPKMNSIEESWVYYTDTKGGCLTGGQYGENGNFGGEFCCLDHWNKFFSYPSDKLVPFLINQLSDTTTTNVHTCPYFMATKGEVATYCLQRIIGKNWYEIDTAYFKYVNGELEPTVDYYSLQDVLQELLENESDRDRMIKSWEKEFYNR